MKKENHVLYVIILCLFLLCSCNKKENGFHKLKGHFPAPVKLEGIRVFKNEIGLWWFLKADSLFVITTTQNKRIHVYNKHYQLISRFGIKGNGPGEFMRPPVIQQAITADTAIHIFAYSESVYQFSEINLTASINSAHTVIDTVYEIPHKLNGAMNMFYVNNTMFVGDYSDELYNRLNGKRGIFYYNPDSKKIKTTLQYMVSIKPYQRMPAVNLNARGPALAPDHKRLATILHYYPVLEVLDVNSSKDTSYLLHSNPPSTVFNLEDFKTEMLTYYYVSSDVTNNAIYLLYSGAKFKNLYSSPTRIQVLDWDGHPEMQYLIPAKYKLSGVNVDEKDKCFYGISYPNDAIYRFNYGSNTSGE